MSSIVKTLKATVSDLYVKMDLAEPTQLELEKIAGELQVVDQLTTKTVFQRGELFEKVAELLPEKEMSIWTKVRCDIEARHARNYRAVARNLSAYKDQAIELGLGATVLFKLAPAEPAQIQHAMELAKEQGYLKVRDVVAILDDGKDTAIDKSDPHSQGGVAGLRLAIAYKVSFTAGSFIELCRELAEEFSTALDGGRIKKADLVKGVFKKARLAAKQLESLTWSVEPNPTVPEVIWEKKLTGTSSWGQVHQLLRLLGGQESWPEAKMLAEWLRRYAVPVLEWASSTAKNPEWTAAAVNSDLELLSREVEGTATVIAFPTSSSRGGLNKPETAVSETEEAITDTGFAEAEGEGSRAEVGGIEEPLELDEALPTEAAPSVSTVTQISLRKKARGAETEDAASAG